MAEPKRIKRTSNAGQIVCPTCGPGKKGTRVLLETECTINRQVYGNCQWLECRAYPRIDVDPTNRRYLARGRGKAPEKFPWQDGVQLVLPTVEG